MTVRGRTRALMDVLTHIHTCDNGRVLLTHIVPTSMPGSARYYREVRRNHLGKLEEGTQALSVLSFQLPISLQLF